MQGENGAVILVGGASAIGSAIAQSLTSNGQRIAIIDINQERIDSLIKKLGIRATVVNCDISCESECQDAIVSCMSNVPGVTGLVNCAGVTARIPSISIEEEQWRRTIDINLSGAFYCARAFAREIVNKYKRSSSIVNIASMFAHRGGPNHAAYVASKAGLVGLTKALAVEWGSVGIRVNAVSPGWVETPLTNAVLSEASTRQYIIDRTPVRRLVTENEVANVVVFLLSDASSGVNGVVVPVDGGLLAGEPAMAVLSSQGEVVNT